MLVPTLFVFELAGGSCALARSFPLLLGMALVVGGIGAVFYAAAVVALLVAGSAVWLLQAA